MRITPRLWLGFGLFAGMLAAMALLVMLDLSTLAESLRATNRLSLSVLHANRTLRDSVDAHATAVSALLDGDAHMAGIVRADAARLFVGGHDDLLALVASPPLLVALTEARLVSGRLDATLASMLRAHVVGPWVRDREALSRNLDELRAAIRNVARATDARFAANERAAAGVVRRQMFWLALLCVAFLFASLSVGRALVRSFLRPLRRLTEATEAIAAGDLARRLPVRGRGELEAVARAVNRVVDRLESRRAHEAGEHALARRLALALLERHAGAAVVVDGAGQVVLANAAAHALLTGRRGARNYADLTRLLTAGEGTPNAASEPPPGFSIERREPLRAGPHAPVGFLVSLAPRDEPPPSLPAAPGAA